MNAKLKLIAGMAALQLIVPTVFADPPVPVPGATFQITGRVLAATPRNIVIRSRGPNAGDWVILRRDDTRVWSPFRVGDTVTVKYNMMATDVTPVTTVPVPVTPVPAVPPRHRY